MLRRLLLLGAVLLLAAGAWFGVQARQVRADLQAAERLADLVEQQAREGTAGDLRPLQRRANAAAETTDSLLWRAASHLPVVGGDVQEVRRSASAVRELSDRAAPALVQALRRTDGLMRGGRVDLGALGALEADVAQAHRVVLQVRRDLRDATGHDAVTRHTGRLREQVADLDEALATAARVLAPARGMLGDDGPRRYLVAVQNNAEARATGGLVGIVAVVRAERGRLDLVRTVTDDALVHAPRPVASDPAAARTWTGMGSTLAWFDANLTPHVPDAARNLAGLWRAQTGERLDGVVLLDAVVLQHLLVKPVRLGATTLSKDDVVDWVARREYVEHPDPAARKAHLRDLAEVLFAQVKALRDPEPLLEAARSGHLFLWSAHAREQALVADHLVGGALPAGQSPYLQVLTQNFGGNKLDYYLHRAVRVRRAGDAYEVAVTLTNRAPQGLPAYVTSRPDRSDLAGSGQARVGLSLYATRGAWFGPWVADRHRLTVRYDVDHGLTLGTTIVELPRGASITVTTRVHMADGELTYRQQPLVRPDRLRLEVPHRVVGD